jgi:hypothetical protein
MLDVKHLHLAYAARQWRRELIGCQELFMPAVTP